MVEGGEASDKEEYQKQRGQYGNLDKGRAGRDRVVYRCQPSGPTDYPFENAAGTERIYALSSLS